MGKPYTRFMWGAIVLYITVYSVLLLYDLYDHSDLAAGAVPIAPLLAYLSHRFFSRLPREYGRQARLIGYALLLQMASDLFVVVGGAVLHFPDYESSWFTAAKLSLDVASRTILLFMLVQFWLSFAKGIGKMRLLWDNITLAECIVGTGWFIYIQDNSKLFAQWEPASGVALLHIVLSLFSLSLILLTWLYADRDTRTPGFMLLLAGFGLAFSTDLLQAVQGELLSEGAGRALIQASMLIIAASALLKHAPSGSALAAEDKEGRSAKEGILFLIYPAMVIGIKGASTNVLLYFTIVIMSYFIIRLHIRQTNVTRKLLDAERKYSEDLKLYQDVIEQSPLSIVITNKDARIEYVNSYFTRLTGYTKEEAVGQNPRILRTNKTSRQTYTNMWDRLTAGKKWEGEFINRKKNGEEYVESVIISPIKNANKDITHYVGIKENVSEYKRIRKELSDQLYFTSQLMDTLPNPLFYLDAHERFIGCNRAYEDAFQVDRNKLKGCPLKELAHVSAENYKGFADARQEVDRSDKPVTVQMKRTYFDNTEHDMLYCVSSYRFSDGAVGGYLGIMTDVSDLKAKEEELEGALHLAEEATVAKSQFLANMSHEIRTPMNAIIGMAHLALMTGLNQKQRDYINKIHHAGKSLLGIINDILDFSKIESGNLEMETTDFVLEELIADSVGLSSQTAHDKDLELLHCISPDIPCQLTGDPLRLGQVITNLVSNAVKFTEAGEVTVQAALEETAQDRIKLRVTVSDTGMGMNRETLGKLFQAFTQADNSTTRKFGGTGLGLAISKELVERMGGQLWAESEEGRGSRFIFTAWLGISANSGTAARVVPERLHSLKVLVADDNETARKILVEYLRNMHCKTHAVSSGEEAIAAVLQADGYEPYDAVLLDWQMGELCGIETAGIIKGHGGLRKIPAVILVTSFGMEELKKQAEAAMVDDFLVKPVSESMLFNSVIRLFAPEREALSVNKGVADIPYNLSGRVLLVEDNEINQQIAAELLSGQGLTVDIASNGAEAVRCIAHMELNRPYELVLMDLQMPEMDGLEAARRMRQMGYSRPIIAMTARTMLQEQEECFTAGMNDHVAKPIDPQLLFAKIAKWLELSLDRGAPGEGDAQADEGKYGDEPALPPIAGINLEEGLRRVGHNRRLYSRLLLKFADHQREAARQMIQALDREEKDTTLRLAHNLKGVSANLGIGRVQALCAEMEKQLHAGHFNQVRSNIELLDALLHGLAGDIEARIAKEQYSHQQHEDEGEVPCRHISVLLRMLQESDSEAIDYYESAKASIRHWLKPQDCQRLERFLEEFEFDDAAHLLEQAYNGLNK